MPASARSLRSPPSGCGRRRSKVPASRAEPARLVGLANHAVFRHAYGVSPSPTVTDPRRHTTSRPHGIAASSPYRARHCDPAPSPRVPGRSARPRGQPQADRREGPASLPKHEGRQYAYLSAWTRRRSRATSRGGGARLLAALGLRCSISPDAGRGAHPTLSPRSHVTARDRRPDKSWRRAGRRATTRSGFERAPPPEHYTACRTTESWRRWASARTTSYAAAATSGEALVWGTRPPSPPW